MQKITLHLFFFLLPFLLLGDGRFYLVKEGKATAKLDFKGNAKLKNFLQIFNGDVKKTSGAFLPWKGTSSGKKVKNTISFRILPAKHFMTEDTFEIRFPKKDVMEIVCTPVSLPWALNHISEEFMGVGFLFNAKCGKSYEVRKTISLPVKAVKSSPSFPAQRYTYISTPVTRPWFRMKEGPPCGHDQFKHAFPKEKYLKNNSYPMAIRPVINGKKLAKIHDPSPHPPSLYWQPCYSHPETTRIAVENIFEYLKKKPKTKAISLTINDCGGFCECKECERVNGNGGPYNFSNVYFRWVNAVAEKVCAKYPDLQIVSLAYSQVYKPCDFKLHKNVMIVLCIDLYSVASPKAMKKHKGIIDAWSKKASSLGVWDYAWGYSYISPRVYFKSHAEMLKYLHKKGCIYYFMENEDYDAKEGPKMYLVYKLLWDINADPEKILDEWYVKCVGKKAAPYLKKYFTFWEDYFRGPEVRKTPWFTSATNTYMSWGEISHCYGLKEGDIAKARSYMEKTLANAVTPGEKERARHLMRHFEYAECLLRLYGAEPIPPEGKISTSKEAAKLLRSIPYAASFREKKKAIGKLMDQEPYLAAYYKNPHHRRLFKLDDDGTDALLSQLMMCVPFLQDKEVAKELEKVVKNPDLPKELFFIAKALAQGDSLPNLYPNGSFEDPVFAPYTYVHKEHKARMGKRSTEKAYKGKYSCKFIPGNYTLLQLDAPAKPDTFYLLTLKVYVPECIPETHLKFAVYPRKDKVHQAWRRLPRLDIVPGRWMTLTAYCKTRKNSNGIRGFLFFQNFGVRHAAYIDDVRLMEIK